MTEQEKRYRRLYRLAREMVSVIEALGYSPMARIDARTWVPYFKKRLKRFKTWNTQ